MAATYITRTPSVAGDLTKWTFSAWIKRGQFNEITESQTLFAQGSGSATYTQIAFKTDGVLRFISEASGDIDQLVTDRLFRDPTCWMHIVCVWDSSNVTEGDRMQLYINGVRETNFSTETYPSTDKDSYIGITSDPMAVGAVEYTGSFIQEFDGCMSHVNYCDGYAYAASDFGSTDASSGMWKINTSPSVSYGTNGFFLKMEDSSNMDLDSSGNALTFATTGNLTATKDNPSNNFCTLNPAEPYVAAGGSVTNGNTTCTQSSTGLHIPGTLGMQGGKYYWEIEINENNGEYGICESGRARQSAPTGQYPYYFVTNPGTTTTTMYNNPRSGSNSSTFTGTSHEIGDVVQMAFDATNGNLYYGKNGSWENSGDPTSGASGTGAVVTGIETQYGGVLVPMQGSNTGSSRTFEYNFGNGYFGTTSHGQTNSDSASIGLFKYSVPSGYYSLCTKNIKTQGGI